MEHERGQAEGGERGGLADGAGGNDGAGDASSIGISRGFDVPKGLRSLCKGLGSIHKERSLQRLPATLATPATPARPVQAGHAVHVHPQGLAVRVVLAAERPGGGALGR